MLSKVTKHSKYIRTSYKQTNKLSTIRFCPAINNSKQDVITYCGHCAACPYLPPFYIIVMDFKKHCNLCKFAMSIARQRAEKLSASGGLRPPDPLTRGSAPGPRWGLCPQTPLIGSRSALAMCPPKFHYGPPTCSTLAPALPKCAPPLKNNPTHPYHHYYYCH